MVKNCDLSLENAALGLRPRAVFSRPRSQFFTIRTSQPANNIYILLGIRCATNRMLRLQLGPGGSPIYKLYRYVPL